MRSVLTVARVTSLLGVFLAVAMLMGVIGAGLVAPVVGAAGLAAREGVGMFERLPGDLDQNPLAQQSKILTADGRVLATPAEQNRIIVESKDISQNMKDAQVAIEDERFYQHGGLDVEALARAVVSNATSETTQGGSTLTQQYIKLALKDEALKDRDEEALRRVEARSGMEGYVRKLRELKYAVTLEERLTKDEILTGYLNLSFYGDNVYGVEAAARHYFNVHAKDLSIAQAATLAGIVRSPTATNPVASLELATARRNTVLDKMYAQDLITAKEWKKAKASKIELDLTDSQRSCINSLNPYFCDYVTAWLLRQPALGATEAEREEKLTTGGLTVTTTLESDLSKKLRKILRETTPKNKYNLGSAATIIEPGTGKVLAFNQSSKYTFDGSGDKVRKTSVDWNVDSAYGGPGGFELGSVAKAYTVVTALEKGVPVEAEIDLPKPQLADSKGVWINNPADPQVPDGQTHPVAVFTKDDFQKGCTIGEDYWTVRNAADENHVPEISLRKATSLSINTAFATLASQVGTCDIIETMTRMGMHDSTGEQFSPFPPAIVLGSDYASPMTVASSYATFAAGGVYCPPVPVTKIVDSNGKEIPLDLPGCERVIDKEIALGAVELLKGVLSPAGSGWKAILEGDRPAGGKTGTNNNSSHTWFAGFTKQLSIAVFVGVPTGAPLGADRQDLSIGDTYVEGVLYGSSLAAPTWKRIMDMASQGMPIEDWEKPSSEILNGRNVTIPAVLGLDVASARKKLEEAGLTASTQDVSSSQAAGTVIYTTPGIGSSIRTSTPVVLHVSTGTAPPSPPPVATQPTQPSQPSPPSQPSQPPSNDDEAAPPPSAPPTAPPPSDGDGDEGGGRGGGGGDRPPSPPGED